MLLKSLKLKNVLSFGGDVPALDLGALNVLVGPNGAGKSNLLDVIAFLRALPKDLEAFLRKMGGTGEWTWKGVQDDPFESATVEAEARIRKDWRGEVTVLYGADIMENWLYDEQVLLNTSSDPEGAPKTLFSWIDEQPTLWVDGEKRIVEKDDFRGLHSVLSLIRDPVTYPEITALASAFSRIRLYRDWPFGRTGILRQPARTDYPNDFLDEDFSNLALVLNSFRSKPAVKRQVQLYLGRLAERFDDFDVRVEGTTVQLFLQEGDWIVPVSRLSDGTLRYLCLLAILLHPEPPPLVCIEEPELGFHPDLMPTLAELLLDASSRTQLIVTTHSDLLLDAFTEHPEVLVVCEKIEGSTRMKRLEPAAMSEWLKEYSLGRLWRTGEIGGNRW